MDSDSIHPLLTSAVRHFPMCEQFGFVFANLRQQLGDYGLESEEADDALLRAAGAVFAEKVPPGSLVGSEVDALTYVAMVRALLDARKRPAEETEDDEQDDTFETARASSSDDKANQPAKKQKVDSQQPSLEEGETTD